MIVFYEKQIYRERDRYNTLPLLVSLPEQLKLLKLSQSKVSRQKLVTRLPRDCRVQGLGPSSAALAGDKQEAGQKVEQLELELSPLLI